MKLYVIVLMIVLGFSLSNCSCNCGEEDIDLQVHMKYGYQDEVNTFEEYLRKDLVQAGTIDTAFTFTPAQKNAILAEANEIGFFDLPEEIESTVDFEQDPSPGEQMLRIKYEDWDHTVTWDSPVGKSENEQKIKQLSYFIINIILETPEYKALPPAEGGYL